MMTCEYANDALLTRTFRNRLTEDVQAVIRALHASVIFECPGAVELHPAEYEDGRWATSVDGGGAAIIRLKRWAPLDGLSLSVEVQIRHREEAEAMLDRLVSRAGAIASAEISEANSRPSLVALSGGPSDDLPF